jgi:hypothetical protein
MAGNEGQVSVRFAVKDAEVVRQALANLGKDGEAALKKMDAAGKPVPKSFALLGDVVGTLRERGTTLAGSLGFVGTALLGLGPIGLAAGAALGAFSAATAIATSKANELEQKAGRLEDFAKSLGITITQLQALQIAGAEAGVSNEKVEAGFGRLAASIDQFRKAQGEAYDQVNRLNPALAEQLARTRDTAQFVNLLAQAWDKADTSQRNALSKAFFGKGGLDMGRLMGEIGNAGGIEKLEKNLSSAIVITAEQAAKLGQLKDAADRAWASAWDRMWGIGAENALRHQKEQAEQLEKISIWLDRISKTDIKQATIDLINGVPSPAAIVRGAYQLGGSIGRRVTGADEFGDRWPAREMETRTAAPGTPLPRPRPDVPPVLDPLTAEAELNRTRALFSVLGGAITPAEQLKIKMLELRTAVASGATTQEMANRGLDEFKDKQAEVAIATRERLGIASAEELLSLRLRRLDDDRARGYIRNAAEMAMASRLATKEAEDQAKALEVRLSATPQLTRLRQDASDLTAQLDQGLASGIRGVGQELSPFNNSVATASERIKNLTMRLADAVYQALLMKAVVGPLTGALGGMFGGGGNPTGFDVNPWSASGVLASANGNVFARGVSGFSNSIVHQPTLFAFARGAGLMGEAGPEAIIPLRRGAGGRLGVDAAGLAPTVNFYAAVEPGLQVRETSRSRNASGGLDIGLSITRMIDDTVAGLVGDSGSRTGAALARAGVNPYGGR